MSATQLPAWVKGYIVVSALAITFLFYRSLSGENSSESMSINDLTVQRINIVEKDGTLKMVISNKERQHPGLAEFKPLPARVREAGIIFFNSSGDECGGLIYDGTQEDAGMVFSVDQFRNDQIMQLQYGQTGMGDTARRYYGLRLWDRSDRFTMPQLLAIMDSLQGKTNEVALQKKFDELKSKGLLGRERMFAGKNGDGEVGLFIRDSEGRIRLKIYCDRDNQPRLAIVDENGRETSALR